MQTSTTPEQAGATAGRASELTYYVFEGVLAGILNGTSVSISAVSGGGGGSKVHPPNAAMNNPYMYSLKEVKGRAGLRGGPIPLGRFKIATPAPHGHLGLAARLTPETPMPNHRGGFFIHGRGPLGSDGCIVPMAAHDFQKIMQGLKLTHGGLLYVRETMDGSRFA
jgi:hypothetical protein